MKGFGKLKPFDVFSNRHRRYWFNLIRLTSTGSAGALARIASGRFGERK